MQDPNYIPPGRPKKGKTNNNFSLNNNNPISNNFSDKNISSQSYGCSEKIPKSNNYVNSQIKLMSFNIDGGEYSKRQFVTAQSCHVVSLQEPSFQYSINGYKSFERYDGEYVKVQTLVHKELSVIEWNDNKDVDCIILRGVAKNGFFYLLNFYLNPGKSDRRQDTLTYLEASLTTIHQMAPNSVIIMCGDSNFDYDETDSTYLKSRSF